MKKIFLLLLITFCIASINAQTGSRDSIIQLLQNDKEDTSRVFHLTELGFLYLYYKPDTTLLLALEALSLSRGIGFAKGEAESLNRIGTAYRVFGDNSKGMDFYLQALKINERINNLDGIQKNYGNNRSHISFPGRIPAGT